MFRDPAAEGHIPGVTGQGFRTDAGGGKHHPGRHGCPERIGPQAVVVPPAIPQPDAAVVDGQRRDEQEAELVRAQGRCVRWSGDAAAVGLQGRVSPAPVLESTGAVRDRQCNSVWGDFSISLSGQYYFLPVYGEIV